MGTCYLGARWHSRNTFELILVLEKGDPKYNLNNFSDVQTAKTIVHNDSTHPHEKPLDLIEKMIEHSSKPGDLILDPFCCSGAICLACKNKGRNFIGIELDEKWAERARKKVYF